MNHFRAVCRSIRHRTVYRVEQDEAELDGYTEEDGHTELMNINCINFNAKSPGILAKLKTSHYQNSVKFNIK